MTRPSGASELRQKVRFERRSDVPDGYGNTKAEWADLGLERSCSLTPTRGGESVQAGRAVGTASWDLWLRNDRALREVTTADRVVNARDSGLTFNIVFGPVDMDGDGRWLFCQLASGGADG